MFGKVTRPHQALVIKKAPSRFWRTFSFLLTFTVFGAATWWVIDTFDLLGSFAKVEPRSIDPRGPLLTDELQTIKVFRKASRSVVFITRVQLAHHAFFDTQQVRKGTGSGIVWDKQGHILTNFHVIQNATQIKVRLANQSVHTARIVGTAPAKDLAVLQIQAPKERLSPITVGDSKSLEIGQTVLAIGNPFGLDRSLSKGVLSARNRQIRSPSGHLIRDVLQTDAAINPGNSGGPLLDQHGRLIGINTAIYTTARANVGIGFAVPVDTLQRIVPQLIRFGEVRRPRLGVQIYHGQELMQHFGKQGAMIVRVVPDSPAAQAGLRPARMVYDGGIVLGDIITSINSKPVRNPDDLYYLLEKQKVGDTVQVGIERHGRKLTLPVKLY